MRSFYWIVIRFMLRHPIRWLQGWRFDSYIQAQLGITFRDGGE